MRGHILKTKLAAALLASVALTGCDAMTSPVATVQCETTQSECLDNWFAEKWEEELALSPLRQTSLGLKTNYDQIDDYSTEGALKKIEWWENAAAEMEANFDYDELNAEAKISYDMFKYRAERASLSRDFLTHEYVLEQMDAPHADLPSQILSKHTVENEAEMEAFIARLGGIGTAMDQLLARHQENAEEGVRPPRFAYNFVIEESKKLISGAPFTAGPPSALWSGTQERLSSLVESGEITQERSDELEEQARTVLIEQTAPAYQRIIDWMAQDRPNSDAEAQGVAALPNGEAFYTFMLAEMTTTDMTADEIHELGLSEVARIRGEMEAIKEQVGFDGTLEEFFEFVRSDPQFFFPNNDAGAQMYIDRATQYIDELTLRLPEFFGRLPKAPLEVRRVEPFREQDGAAQHYREGTPDGSRPGIYYAHLSDMTTMPIPEIETIAYHEGNPGHHMQISIAQELEDTPKFRANGEYIPAFAEGWGLYSEWLAKEMGGFQDPYQDFGRLQNEIWRAIRLVLDTGIHSKGWTEQQAIDYAQANAANPLEATRSEVRRYFVLPGQATSYKIGMIRIQELRRKAEQELGDDFDIRGYHDTVLGGGDMPLSILEQRVDNWIASVKES
ncbi:Prolyl oligopeptidase [Altererythrobacter insulae]|nr:Prolyl oligopeptidase [Altererythrobacter insulae]